MKIIKKFLIEEVADSTIEYIEKELTPVYGKEQAHTIASQYKEDNKDKDYDQDDFSEQNKDAKEFIDKKKQEKTNNQINYFATNFLLIKDDNQFIKSFITHFITLFKDTTKSNNIISIFLNNTDNIEDQLNKDLDLTKNLVYSVNFIKNWLIALTTPELKNKNNTILNIFSSNDFKKILGVQGEYRGNQRSFQKIYNILINESRYLKPNYVKDNKAIIYNSDLYSDTIADDDIYSIIDYDIDLFESGDQEGRKELADSISPSATKNYKEILSDVDNGANKTKKLGDDFVKRVSDDETAKQVIKGLIKKSKNLQDKTVINDLVDDALGEL